MKKYLFILSLVILLIGFILTHYNLIASIILLVVGTILLFLSILFNTKKNNTYKEIKVDNDSINTNTTNNVEQITYLKEDENKLPEINTGTTGEENTKSLVTGKDTLD